MGFWLIFNSILALLPLTAMFILFDFVIHNPAHPETSSNLALLEVAGGHFSRLEYVTGGSLPSSILAQFAYLARTYVRSYQCQKEDDEAMHNTVATSFADQGPSFASGPCQAGNQVRSLCLGQETTVLTLV